MLFRSIGCAVQTGVGAVLNTASVEEGATVRQKQELIRLPDVTQMMVEIKVHESHVRQVKPGLPEGSRDDDG